MEKSFSLLFFLKYIFFRRKKRHRDRSGCCGLILVLLLFIIGICNGRGGVDVGLVQYMEDANVGGNRHGFIEADGIGEVYGSYLESCSLGPHWVDFLMSLVVD